jgi:Flp pilus assembly protein TadB
MWRLLVPEIAFTLVLLWIVPYWWLKLIIAIIMVAIILASIFIFVISDCYAKRDERQIYLEES